MIESRLIRRIKSLLQEIQEYENETGELQESSGEMSRFRKEFLECTVELNRELQNTIEIRSATMTGVASAEVIALNEVIETQSKILKKVLKPA